MNKPKNTLKKLLKRNLSCKKIETKQKNTFNFHK